MDRHDEAIERIRDIRRRIETLRSALCSPQRIQRYRRVEKDQSPVVEDSQERNAELEALKRKLMKK